MIFKIRAVIQPLTLNIHGIHGIANNKDDTLLTNAIAWTLTVSLAIHAIATSGVALSAILVAASSSWEDIMFAVIANVVSDPAIATTVKDANVEDATFAIQFHKMFKSMSLVWNVKSPSCNVKRPNSTTFTAPDQKSAR